MEALLKGIASAAVAYSVHYSSAKLYDFFCVPDGVYGFIQGMFTTGSPVCQAGLAVVSNTQMSYSNLLTIGLTRMVLDMAIPGAGTAATSAAASAFAGSAGATGAAAATAATEKIISNVGAVVSSASSLSPSILTRAASKAIAGI
jgi:hypothetical protein